MCYIVGKRIIVQPFHNFVFIYIEQLADTTTQLRHMKRLAAERSARIDVLEARGIHRFDLIAIVISVCFKFCADDDSIGHSPHRHSRSPRSPRSPKSPKSPSSRHLRAEYDFCCCCNSCCRFTILFDCCGKMLMLFVV
jgi:hypothetical protein